LDSFDVVFIDPPLSIVTGLGEISQRLFG